MKSEYVYFLIDINTFRLPRKKYEDGKMDVFDLEVLIWDSDLVYKFVKNDLSLFTAENEEILKMKPFFDLRDAIDKDLLAFIENYKTKKANRMNIIKMISVSPFVVNYDGISDTKINYYKDISFSKCNYTKPSKKYTIRRKQKTDFDPIFCLD